MRNSNITKNRTRIAVLLVLAASIISLAPACSTSAFSAPYSIYDVSGNYVDLGNGWEYADGVVNAPQSVPYSYVGLITFTPATGTFHAHWIARSYGAPFPVDHDGTYIVRANGHGTMTWLSPNGKTKHADFYIVNAGAELKYIDTDPPDTILVSASGTMTKQ